jgi:hypothetical protein
MGIRDSVVSMLGRTSAPTRGDSLVEDLRHALNNPRYRLYITYCPINHSMNVRVDQNSFIKHNQVLGQYRQCSNSLFFKKDDV